MFQHPNQPILLYEGSMELLYNQQSIQGTGVLNFTWLPSPRITFEMDISSPEFDFNRMEWLHLRSIIDQDYGELALSDLGLNTKVGTVVWRTSKAVGWLQSPITIINGSANKLQYLNFYLVNFCDSKNRQIILESQDWKITIEPLQNLSQLIREVKDSGGYTITHIAKLERCDSKTFSPAQANELLEALFYFLSFARGLWIAPILPKGFDIDGNQAWQEWRLWKVDFWKNVTRSGSSSQFAQRFYNTFSGFLDRWLNCSWRESLRIAIDWYVESNSTGVNIEGSIILAQAGLELLCSVVLEEQRKKALKQEFAKRRPIFSRKLEELLLQSEVSLEVPLDLIGLRKLSESKKANISNGAKVLAKLRNNLTHPEEDNRQELFTLFKSTQVRVEALILSLWYIEVVLLRCFGYHEDNINDFVHFHVSY